MTRELFRTLRGTAVCLRRDDVDTDQIIPARFLTTTERAGLGRHLFADWRLDAAGAERAAFPLNAAHAAGACVLVARRNFGCGSSREHAPWSLLDWGFRAVIAISFGDIFRNNAHQSGLLTVALEAAEVARLEDAVASDPRVRVEVDLPRERVQAGAKFRAAFAVDPFVKRCLAEGLDELDYIRRARRSIARWEAAAARFPSTRRGLPRGTGRPRR